LKPIPKRPVFDPFVEAFLIESPMRWIDWKSASVNRALIATKRVSDAWTSEHQNDDVIRESSPIVRQYGRSLVLSHSWPDQSDRAMLPMVQAQFKVPGASIVSVLNQLFDNRCPLGIVAAYLSYSNAQVRLLTEITRRTIPRYW
jgi:hypothetical protein